MKFHQLLSGRAPMLIEPGALAAVLAHADPARRPHASAPQGMGFFEYFYGARPQPRVEGAVGIIPIRGPIGMGLTEFERDIGCCDLGDLTAWWEAMQANPAVKTILLDVDSPGGCVIGVPEFAAAVRESKKPVIAFTATVCASAAYWIASQAHAVVATPSAYVGSVGVYIAMPDYSVMYGQAGVTIEVIKSGDLKGAGIEGTALTDGQRAQLQDEVTAIHAAFKAAVTAVRTAVVDDSMRGQCFTGADAAVRGMATGLVRTRADLMRRLSA